MPEELRLKAQHKKITLRTCGKVDMILTHIKTAKDQ